MSTTDQENSRTYDSWEHNNDAKAKRIVIRAQDPVSGNFVNIAATDNGDGTYSLKTTATITGTVPLPTGAATSANQSTIITNLQTINSLVPSTYDYISLAYTGDNLTTVVFKSGGSGGTTISTLTLAYSGSTLTSVTKT